MNSTPSTINTPTDICNSFRAEMLDGRHLLHTRVAVAEHLNIKCLRESNYAAATFFVPRLTEKEDGFDWGYDTTTWAINVHDGAVVVHGCEKHLKTMTAALITTALEYEDRFGLDINDFAKACNFGLISPAAPAIVEDHELIANEFKLIIWLIEDVNDAGDYALKDYINQHARAILAEVASPEEE